jgi:hypothetical protein
MSSPRREPGVVVFLQVFSGREDPSWALDDDQLAAVAQFVNRARDERSHKEPPRPVLGYKGFRVENRARAAGLPPVFTVWRGSLVAQAPGGIEVWEDVADLEGWLLEDARRRGYEELLAEAGAPGMAPS